jgi:dihydroorotate dehydrogenase
MHREAAEKRDSGLYGCLRPLLFRLAPETAHGLAIGSLKLLQCLGARIPAAPETTILRQRLWGLDFPNPVGLAAGFDKDAEVWQVMLWLGFGFAEVGSVTPLPQPGNPRPRLFRLTASAAVINRMGFNNHGVAAMAQRLRAAGRDQRRSASGRTGVLGINLGKNKATEDAAADYEIGIRALAEFADYLVINVSSPNTPGLRALQGRGPLQALIARSAAALKALSLPKPPPLLLKIAPDLMPEDLQDVAAVALAARAAGELDGLVVSNTTITRPAVIGPQWAAEPGGLSGQPLFEQSTEILRAVYRLTEGRLPIIGVGGIASGAEAYAKIRAGASLVQLYSALIFRGPRLARRIQRELQALLVRDGFANITDAIGADHRQDDSKSA